VRALADTVTSQPVTETAGDVVRALAGGVWDAVDAPARALRGEPVTYGDAFNTAGAAQLGGAAMPAPRGAIRAGAVRSADDLAETPAATAARLLREGRANEVTDDLMAQVDPQEMARLYESGATGMDMPLDEASRMARAREMGFDTEAPLYHGTAADFQTFSRDGAEMNFGANQAEVGHFFTNSPRYAGQYTEPPWNGFPGGPNVQPTVARGQFRRFDGDMIDDIETNWTADDAAAWRKGMEGSGAQGVQFGPVRYEGQNPVNEIAIFDPTNIRSRFARFDPRLSHLANLNAANVDPMAGVLGLSVPDDEELRAYLERVQ